MTRLNKPTPAMNMRALWRLAIWGASAAAALTLVVVASFSDTGSRRIATAMASPTGKDDQKAPIQVAVRSAEQDAETRRLAEVVRTLTADRDRLAARLGAVERNLEDMTGSIKRQATAPASAAADAPVREAAVSPAAVPAGKQVAPPGAAEPQPAAPEAAVQPNPAPEAAETVKAEMGIDVGGATSPDGLRALWTSTKTNHAAVVEGLHPVVATRENGRNKSKEMRLILGPVDSLEAATQLCMTLAAARRYCQPVAFEGQKLADAPERKPAPKSAAPAPNTRLPALFR